MHKFRFATRLSGDMNHEISIAALKTRKRLREREEDYGNKKQIT